MGDNIVFQKLTPIDSVKMEVYEDAFNYVFQNTDVKNVAISGPYSAGKSSVLESYKKNHSNKKFLHISLAHFEETIVQNITESNRDIETILEGKILNQLIQQIKVENIPQTNFRVKRTVSNIRCVTFSFGIVIFILSILHLKYFNMWSDWIASLSDSWIKALLLKSTNPYSLIISGIVATLILGIGIYQLIKTQKNKNIFRKLNVQGNEIEIFGEDDNSYFDKYLNEVLYLFENSGVDVIVFEDLDRFNDNKIFERLREINILSNIRIQNRKDKKQMEPLRFFYLLRDDIFVNKDRTKFFDFILPVVPVVDSSNAFDQMKKHFELGGIFSVFEEKFLRGLSLYIDDMRVLKNIYNEFMVYFNKLNTIELNPNKMLAIITYKNIFPRDFLELQLNQGFVYELFTRKQELIKQEKIESEEKIKDKEIQIDYLKKEKLESITELDDVKEARMRRISPHYSRHEEDIKKFNEWTKKQYPLRKRAIEDKMQNCLEELEEELLLLQEENRTIGNRMLHEIITRENVDEIFRISSRNEIGDVNEYKEIKSSEYFALLKYLIWNGYIDESYNDYMTFFYENSLTKGDKMFLRSITDKIAKPFSYQLDNVILVMSNLDISDFDQEETLNFDLFEYLLQNEDKREILLYFVKQLKKECRVQFISEFFETDREKARLVVIINNQWPQFFEQVNIRQRMSVKQIRDYSIATLEYTNEDDLHKINVNNCLTDYISSQKDYLAIQNPNVVKICDAMKTLGISFNELDYEISNKDLFRAVYQNSFYEININNICLMLEVEYHIENIEDALKQCISLIYSQPEQPLCKYVQENMDLLMESILGIQESEFTDRSTDAVMIINDDNISEEYKVAYIARLKTLIDILEDIDEVRYQTELITKLGVQYTVENILEYYGKVGLTDELVEFINSGREYLNYKVVSNHDLIERFWSQCISNKKLTLHKYREILLSISPSYSMFDTVGVPYDKMGILIKEKYIPMTEETLLFMRQNYESIKMDYIIGKIYEYVNIATGSMASAEEIKDILLCEVTDEVKIKLLDEIVEKISIVDQNYSDEIIVYILKNNLDNRDLPKLFQNYKNYSLKVQKEILKIAKRNIVQISTDPKNINNDIIIELLKDTSISETDRINLFITIIKEITSDECKQYLAFLGLSEFVKIFEYNRRPKITINPMNKKILVALKDAGFIDRFIENEEEKVYKKIRRRIVRTELPNELL